MQWEGTSSFLNLKQQNRHLLCLISKTLNNLVSPPQGGIIHLTARRTSVMEDTLLNLSLNKPPIYNAFSSDQGTQRTRFTSFTRKGPAHLEARRLFFGRVLKDVSVLDLPTVVVVLASFEQKIGSNSVLASITVSKQQE